MYTIEIINPLYGKGLNREYLARDEIKDEFNYLEIGAIVRGSDGKPVNDIEVVVTATDETQNSDMTSTGNVTKIFDTEGNKQVVPYYPFHYEFRTVGDHTITFGIPNTDISEAATINVPNEDTRPK